LVPWCRYDDRWDENEASRKTKSVLCSKSYHVGDIQIPALILNFAPEDSLSGYSMSFATGSYNQMRTVVLEKFGTPTATSTEPYTTGGGQSVSGQVLAWAWPNGTVATLHQLCGKTVESCLRAGGMGHERRPGR
jgi:hypothetical protein